MNFAKAQEPKEQHSLLRVSQQADHCELSFPLGAVCITAVMFCQTAGISPVSAGKMSSFECFLSRREHKQNVQLSVRRSLRSASYQEGTRRPAPSRLLCVCQVPVRLSGSVTSKGWLLYGVPIHQAWKQYTGQPVALPHRTALSLYKLPFEHVSHEMCQNMMSMSLIVAIFFGGLAKTSKAARPSS